MQIRGRGVGGVIIHGNLYFENKLSHAFLDGHLPVLDNSRLSSLADEFRHSSSYILAALAMFLGSSLGIPSSLNV